MYVYIRLIKNVCIYTFFDSIKRHLMWLLIKLGFFFLDELMKLGFLCGKLAVSGECGSLGMLL